ncbi:NitT/TauT family transport system substrate-binding protein [Halanaerobium sp. DL-01]|uniref:ABC transporter substrate-binding protein n=1 Tax=Halanaerobium sp. DL-01 TaxID=1653064 RepID=UPI000DF27E47|nr:ABC transporter substrate-binding protein [Halanaerobium sp. DL-01]RCW89067.1 NitT/TauT family transport system substrate-binding protein [Halanaerobium sp. DL-01]
MKKTITLLILTTAVLTIGCSTINYAEAEDLSLKIGLMPAVDSAPIFLAEEKGYFAELGLDVDMQIYRNANNRQTALQSGALDGAITDLIAFINNVNNGFGIKITTSTDGSFPFLVKKDFKEKDKIEIGMMKVSVSNFLSEKFLADKYELKKIYIPAIPARLEMIAAGQLDMAIIPEPMASMGELRGLKKRFYENKDEFMPEAMIFTETALKNKEKEIELFHRAYNKAVEDIKKDDAWARKVLIARLELNPKIEGMIEMPEYHYSRVPSQEYMSEIIDWVEKVQNEIIDVKYEDMVERKFNK